MHPPSRLFCTAALAAVLALAQSTAPPKPQAQPLGQPPGQAPAQSSGQQSDEAPTFTAGTKLVALQVTVTDKNGKLVTNVPQSAFKVYENNVEQPIKLFKREDVPVSMGIIIDNSGSMRESRAKVAAASIALVKASNPEDEEFVVNFNDDAFLDQPFTNNVKKLEVALDRIDSRGGTAMRDAISMSIDYTKQHGKHDKRVLMVVTDGYDNASSISEEDLVRKAQQSEVLIYCIGLLSDEDPREGRKAKRQLSELTAASGGMAYYPKDLLEVDRITPEVAQEIRSQYIIGYSPLNNVLDGSYRRIRVAVNGYGHPNVRTRSGYFATPEAKKTLKPPSSDN